MSVERDVTPEIEETTAETVTVDTEYSRTVVQPLLIALMVTALATAALAVFEVAVSRWPWRWFIPFCFLVALEGIYTTIWLHHPDRRILNRRAYRAAEFVVILIVVRLLAWGLNSWPEDWLLFMREPLQVFADPFFILTLAVMLIAWQRGIFFSYIFYYMAIDPAERTFYTQSTLQRRGDERPISLHRTTLLKLYGRAWIWGGVIMAFLAAVSTVDLPHIESERLISITRLQMPTEMLLALLVYFGAGFALLSQARLAALNARWLMSRVQKTEAIERSWSRNTLWILLIVGGIAAFLPLGSTTLIGRLLEMLVVGIALLTAFLTFLFLGLLAMLLPGRTAQTEQEPPPPPLELPEPAPAAEPAGLIEIPWQVTGTLFWLVAGSIAVVAIVFFLRERGIKFDRTIFSQVWSRLSSWWRSLWQGVRMQVVDWRDAVVTRLVWEDGDETTKRPWRFIRFNALTPRQKLRYFYLSTVRRAEERGVGRLESETPLEYAHDLKEGWPQTDHDVDVLTAAFLKARYSPGRITEQDVSAVQGNWKQLRRELKRRVQENKNEASES